MSSGNADFLCCTQIQNRVQQMMITVMCSEFQGIRQVVVEDLLEPAFVGPHDIHFSTAVEGYFDLLGLGDGLQRADYFLDQERHCHVARS